MIRAVQWLLKKCPNVLLVLAGLWIASIPVAFKAYFQIVEVYARKTGAPATGINAVLRRIYSICNRFDEPISVAQLFFLFLGLGMAITGAIRMIPWMYPRPAVNPPAPNPDAPADSD